MWNPYSYTANSSSGLLNSVELLSKALAEAGIVSRHIEVQDNNSIDKYVTLYKPDVVFIEALWVVPSKFDVLVPLHPRVKWIVRLHSESAFLAQEGIAMEWIAAYVQKRNVSVVSNSSRLYHELNEVFHPLGARIGYAPNFYPLDEPNKKGTGTKGVVNIGCFGAIRPLKNQLIQAHAAIKFAQDKGLKLRYHINSSRSELAGDSVIRNIRGLFAALPQHELVELPWLDHVDFVKYIAENIDLALQVSFTETFNIVGADVVSQNVPIVTSAEVRFVLKMFQADPTDLYDIVKKMKRAWFWRHVGLHNLNKWLLKMLSDHAICVWKDLLKK